MWGIAMKLNSSVFLNHFQDRMKSNNIHESLSVIGSALERRHVFLRDPWVCKSVSQLPAWERSLEPLHGCTLGTDPEGRCGTS